MANDSVKLAQFWVTLQNIKNTLDNEMIPVSGHLGVDDPELVVAMEGLSLKIEDHFNNFKLFAAIKNKVQE